MRFLDNVLQDFIDKAPDSMSRAKYSATRERSIGLGAMGLHSFLQNKSVPIESAMSKVWNKKIFQNGFVTFIIQQKECNDNHPRIRTHHQQSRSNLSSQC